MDTQPDNQRPNQEMPIGTFIASAAFGALVMYLLDPERGAGRRAAAAGAVRDVSRETRQTLGEAVQDLTHRAGAADVFHASDREFDAAGAHRADSAGARATGLVPQGLGSILSKPASAITTVAQELRKRSWDPKVRNAAMWGSGALGLFGLATRRTPLTVAAGLAGAAVMTRSAAAQSGQKRADRGAGTGADMGPTNEVEIEKTIRIDATPERVYDMFADYENFPRYMANVLEVRDLGANLSHWRIKGPAGSRFEWDSVLTEQARPHRLSWRTVPGGEIEHRGEVWLDPISTGTRATVRMTYMPPAGAIGHALATLLGKNPAAQLEDDLQRLKTLLERGSLPHRAAQAGSADSRSMH